MGMESENVKSTEDGNVIEHSSPRKTVGRN